MKKILFCILFLSIFIFSCLYSFSAPDFNPVQITGDLESSGSIRFVESGVGTSVVGYFSFPVDRYYQIDSAYLGNYSIPFEYEGIFIEYQSERFYNQVVFSLSNSNLLEAYSRGDTLFLNVSAPSYSSHDIDISYISDDGFNLTNADFSYRITYSESDPLSQQDVLIPYYVNYSDGSFIYTYRFDSAYFTKNFPGVVLTYNLSLEYVDGDPFVRLKFNDSNNSSLLYNDNVDIKVIYSLLSSAPVGSSTLPGGSPNNISDSFYFLTYLSYLAAIPYNAIAPALDIDVFGVNILFAFNCLLSFVIIGLVVFIVIKVVK